MKVKNNFIDLNIVDNINYLNKNNLENYGKEALEFMLQKAKIIMLQDSNKVHQLKLKTNRYSRHIMLENLKDPTNLCTQYMQFKGELIYDCDFYDWPIYNLDSNNRSYTIKINSILNKIEGIELLINNIETILKKRK